MIKKNLIFALCATLLPLVVHGFTIPTDTKIEVPIAMGKVADTVVVDEELGEVVTKTADDADDEASVVEDQRIAGLVAQQVAAELQKYEQQAQEETGKPVRRFKKRGYLTDRAWTLGSTAVVASLVGIIGTLGGVALWQAVRKPAAGAGAGNAGAPGAALGVGNAGAPGAGAVVPGAIAGAQPAGAPGAAAAAVGAGGGAAAVGAGGAGAAVGAQPAGAQPAGAAVGAAPGGAGLPPVPPVQGWGAWGLKKVSGAGSAILTYFLDGAG